MRLKLGLIDDRNSTFSTDSYSECLPPSGSISAALTDARAFADTHEGEAWKFLFCAPFGSPGGGDGPEDYLVVYQEPLREKYRPLGRMPPRFLGPHLGDNSRFPRGVALIEVEHFFNLLMKVRSRVSKTRSN